MRGHFIWPALYVDNSIFLRENSIKGFLVQVYVKPHHGERVKQPWPGLFAPRYSL
jgi:hypothetical protein